MLGRCRSSCRCRLRLVCWCRDTAPGLRKTPDPNNHALRNENPAAFKFLLLLAYSALMFNASATVASLIMIDALGALPLRAKKWYQYGRTLSGGRTGDDYLLEQFGAGTRWTWARNHCIFSLVAGSWCIFLQIVLYVWLHEALSVAITLSVVFAVCVSPWFALLCE